MNSLHALDSGRNGIAEQTTLESSHLFHKSLKVAGASLHHQCRLGTGRNGGDELKMLHKFASIRPTNGNRTVIAVLPTHGLHVLAELDAEGFALGKTVAIGPVGGPNLRPTVFANNGRPSQEVPTIADCLPGQIKLGLGHADIKRRNSKVRRRINVNVVHRHEGLPAFSSGLPACVELRRPKLVLRSRFRLNDLALAGSAGISQGGGNNDISVADGRVIEHPPCGANSIQLPLSKLCDLNFDRRSTNNFLLFNFKYFLGGSILHSPHKIFQCRHCLHPLHLHIGQRPGGIANLGNQLGRLLQTLGQLGLALDQVRVQLVGVAVDVGQVGRQLRYAQQLVGLGGAEGRHLLGLGGQEGSGGGRGFVLLLIAVVARGRPAGSRRRKGRRLEGRRTAGGAVVRLIGGIRGRRW
mmetsp:Transcript_3993/g.11360  ORF Transcript_3993/g.11360 Transcript_3993/m.11360 type:complete len:410 (+) Transcript_3993:654-1883(+)